MEDGRQRVGEQREKGTRTISSVGQPNVKGALVLSLLKGETSIEEAARQHGLTVAELEDWKERFLLTAENALRASPKDEEALK